jgi:hypothetical protein
MVWIRKKKEVKAAAYDLGTNNGTKGNLGFLSQNIL